MLLHQMKITLAEIPNLSLIIKPNRTRTVCLFICLLSNYSLPYFHLCRASKLIASDILLFFQSQGSDLNFFLAIAIVLFIWSWGITVKMSEAALVLGVFKTTVINTCFYFKWYIYIIHQLNYKSKQIIRVVAPAFEHRITSYHQDIYIK